MCDNLSFKKKLYLLFLLYAQQGWNKVNELNIEFNLTFKNVKLFHAIGLKPDGLIQGHL